MYACRPHHQNYYRITAKRTTPNAFNEETLSLRNNYFFEPKNKPLSISEIMRLNGLSIRRLDQVFINHFLKSKGLTDLQAQG